MDELLAAHAPVAMGVSGGKDSSALAFALSEYLDGVGHTGPRILVHSDLGRVEWRQSLPACQKLAERLGLELAVVRRPGGGLMERWRSRWRANVLRYADLLCVKLILPWSTASMRFCTSELKTDVICRHLVKRFPGRTIVSATGIRREEGRGRSSGRAVAPACKPQPKLSSATHRTSGVDWHPILEWSVSDVLALLAARQFPLHEAYTRFGSTRVSCAFCILASRGDLRAAASCGDNADVYREMVRLEADSTFSFQDSHWLGDVAPHLLDRETLDRLSAAKQLAEMREAQEARIPAHLLYEKGWPKVMPTAAEAELLADVRRRVSALVGIPINYTDADSVAARYRELIEARRRKGVRA